MTCTQQPDPLMPSQPRSQTSLKPACYRPPWKRKRVFVPVAVLLLSGISGCGGNAEGPQTAKLAAADERAQEDEAAAAQADQEAAAAEAAEDLAIATAEEEAAAAKAAAEAAAAAKAAEEAAAAQAAAEAAAAQEAAAQAAQAVEQAAAQQAAVQQAASAAAAVSYENCDAVRAAGAAPIHRGDPGYAKKLDRDGDGIGCDVTG